MDTENPDTRLWYRRATGDRLYRLRDAKVVARVQADEAHLDSLRVPPPPPRPKRWRWEE